MFEKKTAEEILSEMLARVPQGYDTRPNSSYIWNALAPAAQVISEMYDNIDNGLNDVFPETASFEGLKAIADCRGITYAPDISAEELRGLVIGSMMAMPYNSNEEAYRQLAREEMFAPYINGLLFEEYEDEEEGKTTYYIHIVPRAKYHSDLETTEYTCMPTPDTAIVEGHTYYAFSHPGWELVENPDISEIEYYYEKTDELFARRATDMAPIGANIVIDCAEMYSTGIRVKVRKTGVSGDEDKCAAIIDILSAYEETLKERCVFGRTASGEPTLPGEFEAKAGEIIARIVQSGVVSDCDITIYNDKYDGAVVDPFRPKCMPVIRVEVTS